MKELIDRYKNDPDFTALVNQLLYDLRTIDGYPDVDIENAFVLSMHLRQLQVAGKISISYKEFQNYCYCEQDDIIGIGRRGITCSKCGKKFEKG